MRRRIRRRAGLALLLLLSTPLQASASPPGPALLVSPSAIPEDPHPVPVRIRVEGEPATAYEVKVWIGSRDRQASHAWNGSGWHRSDHYVRTVATDDRGRWTGWVAVRPNPESAGYPALVDEADETRLHVRTRPAGGGGEPATASRPVRVLEPGESRLRVGRAPGAAYVAAPDGNGSWASLAPVAPDPRTGPAPAEDLYRLPVPEEAGEPVRVGPEGQVLGPVPEADPPPLRLVEAVPHAYGSGEPAEAAAVANRGDGAVDLAGVCLEARGTACFRDGTLPAGDRRTVARNASAYEAATGRPAEAFPPPAGGEALDLPDGGGRLELTYLGSTLDHLVYGNVSGVPGEEEAAVGTPRPGEVLRRVEAPAGNGSAEGAGGNGSRERAAGNGSAAWAAGNGSATWTTGNGSRGRATGNGSGTWVGGTRLGQTRLDPASFRLEGPAWTAVAPGETYDLAVHLLRRAEERIRVEAYLLTSPSLARELARALDRGVDVDVLVEGSPVGGRPEVEDRILSALARRGADVAAMASTPTFRARYPAVHAKAVTVDGEVTLVSTENLARSGYPPGGDHGNRGWAVAVADPDLTGYVAGVMAADAGPRPDVQAIPPGEASLPPRPVAPAPEPPDPADASGARARPVVAPDLTGSRAGPGPGSPRDPILEALDSASRRVDVQLLSLDPRFEEGPNPYLEALLDAARRGVQVRVLLDGTYVDEATGTLENAPAREALRAAAAREDLPVQVRVAGALDVEKVHTKGAVVDGETAVVGSVNWVEPALTRNRELGLVVEAPAVAAAFQEAFARDWRRSLPSAGVLPPTPAPLGGAALGLAAAGLAAVGAAAGRRDRSRR